MNKILNVFFKSISIMRADKIIIVLSLIPVAIGAALYLALGNFFYVDLLSFCKKYIEQEVGSGGWMTFFTYVFTALLTVGFYFFVSWTFVLIVSLLASPFNEMISSRVEKAIQEKRPDELVESLRKSFGRVLNTLKNECKKISFILLLSILSIIIGFFFPPLSLLLSGVLVAISFLDYSWSRHNYSVKYCLKDYRKNFISYTISGLFLMFLITIPIVNLFALPFGVIYFTVFFSRDSGIVYE